MNQIQAARTMDGAGTYNKPSKSPMGSPISNGIIANLVKTNNSQQLLFSTCHTSNKQEPASYYHQTIYSPPKSMRLEAIQNKKTANVSRIILRLNFKGSTGIHSNV